MRSITITLLLAFLGVLGCATTTERLASYSERSNVTRYRSAVVPMVIHPRYDTPGAARNLTARAFAQCSGRYCAPEEVEISLANTGSPRQADFEMVSIQAGTARVTWEDVWLGGPHQASIGRGEFLRVSVPIEFFLELASETDARVVLGSTVFDLPHGSRRAFRNLVEAMGIDDERFDR